MNSVLKTKLGAAASVVAGLVVAGTIASASAAPSPNVVAPGSDLSGYTKDQCKHGGWKDFKNPDGSMMFKNQGQCVRFFATGQTGGGGDNTHVSDSLVHHILTAFAAFLAFGNNFFGNLLGGLFGGLV